MTTPKSVSAPEKIRHNEQKSPRHCERSAAVQEPEFAAMDGRAALAMTGPRMDGRAALAMTGAVLVLTKQSAPQHE